MQYDAAPPEIFRVLEKVARARRLAWNFRHDPIAGELTRYADELMAEAMSVEAELYRKDWHE